MGGAGGIGQGIAIPVAALAESNRRQFVADTAAFDPTVPEFEIVPVPPPDPPAERGTGTGPDMMAVISAGAFALEMLSIVRSLNCTKPESDEGGGVIGGGMIIPGVTAVPWPAEPDPDPPAPTLTDGFAVCPNACEPAISTIATKGKATDQSTLFIVKY